MVAPPSALKPQPIPPSADWRIDLARGCPAHCQYCYLAGSLTGPPITRVYANLDEVLAGIGTHAGAGAVTSGTAARGHEGTTFELSCYTDPLGIEHLTGALATAISRVGAGAYGPEVVAAVHHQVRRGGRPARRLTTSAAPGSGSRSMRRRWPAGSRAGPDPPRPGWRRCAALAEAGYPVGLTIAPVMPMPGWGQEYGALLDEVGAPWTGCRTST